MAAFLPPESPSMQSHLLLELLVLCLLTAQLQEGAHESTGREGQT